MRHNPNVATMHAHPQRLARLRSRHGERLYWTPERVAAHLRRFVAWTSGVLPKSDREWDVARLADDPPSTAIYGRWPGVGFRRIWMQQAGAPIERISLLSGHDRWTEDEDAHLLQWAGIRTLEQLARELHRTYGACRKRLQDLGTSARTNQGYLSAAEVSREYGAPYSRVTRLIADGLIPMTHSRTCDNRYEIDPAAITPEVEALLRAPKQTYTTFESDHGDYAQRYGLVRHSPDRTARA